MKQPDEFDAFYKGARTRLLLQTYALTGDLPASRSAVRDSFVVTWHHWRKVSRLADPESWVRPHAWAQAQRRHTTRIWHRDRNLDPEAARTLESLGKLSLGQRKALLLDVAHHAAARRTRPRARPDPPGGRAADAAPQSSGSPRCATSTRRIPAALRAAARPGRGAPRWPRASILRRSGAARRRTHTLVGAVAGLAALVATGFVVDGTPRPDRGCLRPTSAPAARSTPSRSSPAQFDADALVGASRARAGVDGDRLAGHPHQRQPRGRRPGHPLPGAALRRPARPAPPWSAPSPPARARGEPKVSAVQTAELSDNRQGGRGGRGTSRWPGTPAAPPRRSSSRATDAGRRGRATRRCWSSCVTGAGDAPTSPGSPAPAGSPPRPFFRTDDNAGPDVAGATRMLVLAVNGMCPTPQGAGCATTPADRGGRPGPRRRGPGPARQRRPADGAEGAPPLGRHRGP